MGAPRVPGGLRFSAGGALLILGAVLLVQTACSRPLWLVEESLASEWGRALQDAPAPPFSRTASLSPEASFPPGGRGVLITARTDRIGGEAPAGPAAVYPWLSQTREWRGALVLAVDPWMLFRKLGDPLPPRSRVEAPGAGVLICPGGEDGVVYAWVSQLVQDTPGAFPESPQRWQLEQDNLFRGLRFQHGAQTYTWVDVWPLLFRDNPAWVYAPLSVIRELPPYRMGLLEASRFPEKAGWNEYGVQADLLWAVPFGWKPGSKEWAAVAEWLKSPEVQALIANELGWAPAHPLGAPYNTVSWEAQAAWINSTFVWEGVEHAEKTEG
jgi:hypothetical protein